jgi:hypothetical protein
VPSGSPATATLHFTHLYEDQTDPTVNIFPWGDGATNITADGSATNFIGFYGLSFSATEALRQAIMPIAGTFERFFCRYVTSAGTTYNVEIRVNGAVIDTVTIAAATVGTLHAETISVPVVAGDLVSFRVLRTGGSGTGFVMYAQLLWRAA